MLICNDTSFVTDAIIYILIVRKRAVGRPQPTRVFTHLKTAFAEELISRAERYLNDGSEFCHFFCGIILNVGNTLGQVDGWNANIDKREDTSKYATSCFTMAFQATNCSIRTSEGRRSCGVIFFLMRDWERDMVEPCLLAREIEVALDIEAASVIL
jgi:hypothetical protein